MTKLAILLGGAVLVAACSTNRQEVSMPVVTAMDPNDPLTAPGFLAQAGSGSMFEIQSSQLALQVSQNQAVRNFANLIIADHQRLMQAAAAAAASAGITPPPPVLLPPHQAALEQLRAAGAGPAFDIAFRQAQIDAHQQALTLMQNYATSGDVPALRAAASQSIPTLQMHLQQAQVLPVAAPAFPAPPPNQGERG